MAGIFFPCISETNNLGAKYKCFNNSWDSKTQKPNDRSKNDFVVSVKFCKFKVKFLLNSKYYPSSL